MGWERAVTAGLRASYTGKASGIFKVIKKKGILRGRKM